MKILVINPGSTSTKIAIYEGKNQIFSANVKMDLEELKKFTLFTEEMPLRMRTIEEELDKNGFSLNDFDAFAGRGGPLKPLKAGIYKVTDEMKTDILEGKYQTAHASLLGAMITHELSSITGKPSFIVDPISTDEMWDFAKLTGHPEIRLQALTHALNVRACARKIAEKSNKTLGETQYIVAHLGGGISINSVKYGSIVEVTETRQTGPFSPTSCGDLPIKQFVKWLKQSNYPLDKITDLFNKSGGLLLYFGTDDVKSLVEKKNKDPRIAIVLKAMVYQISRTIASHLPSVNMAPDAIILTGGLAHSDFIVNGIKEWLSNSHTVEVLAGEFEMEALAFGTIRALNGEENILNYSDF